MLYQYVQPPTFCCLFQVTCFLVQRLQSKQKQQPGSLLVWATALLRTRNCKITLNCFFLKTQKNFQGFFFLSFFKKCWQMEKSTSLFFFFSPSQDLFNFSFLTSFIYLSANIKSSPLPKLCFYTDIQRLQSSQPFTWSLFKQIELLEPFTARHIF